MISGRVGVAIYAVVDVVVVGVNVVMLVVVVAVIVCHKFGRGRGRGERGRAGRTEPTGRLKSGKSDKMYIKKPVLGVEPASCRVGRPFV